MALMDIFDKEKRRQASIARNQKRLAQKYGQPDGRQKAIIALRDDGSEEAIRALLMRFTIAVEPGITDQEEKEWVHDILLDFGSRSLDPIRRYLGSSQTAVTWPLRVLQELKGKPYVVETVCEVLRKSAEEYQREHTKKITLIKHLIELDVRSELVTRTLLLFLEDMDGDTVIASIEALEKLDEDGLCREPLLELFREKADESPRLKTLVFDVFAARAWDVKGFRPTVEERIAEPYYLTSDGVMKKRGS